MKKSDQDVDAVHVRRCCSRCKDSKNSGLEVKRSQKSVKTKIFKKVLKKFGRKGKRSNFAIANEADSRARMTPWLSW